MHVLDQFVQASRLELHHDGVDLELDLTPGVEIAQALFFQINTNRDGQISDAECRAYANRVVRDLVVTADATPLTLHLRSSTCPAFDEMRAGTGTIRLQATSAASLDRSGEHRVFYRNQHQADRSVYLVNALAPASPRIVISGQARDYTQREVTIAFTTVAGGDPTRGGSSIASPALVVGLTVLLLVSVTYGRLTRRFRWLASASSYAWRSRSATSLHFGRRSK